MSKVEKMLSEIDNVQEKLDETEIGIRLEEGLQTPELSESEMNDLKNEVIAFKFHENFIDWTNWIDGGWGTYFGPTIVWPNEDGTQHVFPHRSLITKETIEYWHARMTAAKHPVLKARYAGLIWDFHKFATGTKRPIESAEYVVDSVVEMARKRQYKYEMKQVSKLKRALDLAVLINDSKRIDAVKAAILEYEENVLIGATAFSAWSISFDSLMDGKNCQKVNLTPEEKKGVIKRIEDKFESLIKFLPKDHAIGVDPIKEAAMRLTKFYKKEGHKEKAEKTVLKYTDAACQQADLAVPIFAQNLLTEAYQIAEKNGLNETANKIALKLEMVNKDLHDSLHIISVTGEFSQKQKEECIERLADADLNTCLQRLSFNSIPPKSSIKDQVKSLGKAYPLVYMASRTLVDDKGRPIAHVGSLDKDLERHIVLQYATNIRMSRGLRIMRDAVNRVFEKHKVTITDLMDYLYQSSLFDEDMRPVIESGLTAYLNFDPINAIHTLIPQLENALRNILPKFGISCIKENRNRDGFNLKILGELLREDAIINCLGENILFHFNTVFNDPCGLNLRNNVCHGTASPADLTMETADLVFEALLIVSRLFPRT